MSRESEVDVIVVGAGIAGMVAANRAAEFGRRVLVLEKGSDEKYLCNSRFTGGTFHVCFNDVMSDEDVLTEAINSATHGRAKPEVVAAIVKDGRRVVRWLQAEGVRFIRAPAAHQSWVLAPPSRLGPGLHWEGRGGDVMLRTLEKNLRTRGGDLLRGTPATALIMDHGRCVGVEANGPEGALRLKADAVVLADGGFQGNSALVGQTITAHPDKLLQRGAGTGTGDCLRMARDIGAGVADLESYYGHLLSRDALTDDGLWPYPYLDSLATAGILLNAEGRRFADEGRGGVYVANMVGRMADPLSAFVVFDKKIWDGPGTQGAIPANPHLANAGGTIHTAPTVEALAERMGLPVSAVAETVAAYNAAVSAGTLADLDPARTQTSSPALPIAEPPFHGVPACSGITYTMGGIVIDGDGRVLDAKNSPIPGLYAAGCTTAGLEGGPEAGYTGGLVKSSAIAIRAAEAIAAA